MKCGFKQGTRGGRLGRLTFAKEPSSWTVLIGTVCLVCWVVRACYGAVVTDILKIK